MPLKDLALRKIYSQKQYQKNKHKWKLTDEGKAKKRDRYHANRDTELARTKDWQARNPEKVRAYERSERSKALRKKRRAERIKEDPIYAIKERLRCRIYKAVAGLGKHKSSEKLLGCSVDHAMHHIESQFKPGMTWDNWTSKGWHIDHVRPLCSFNLKDPLQLEAACHYMNLQPMWWRENLVKGKKIQA